MRSYLVLAALGAAGVVAACSQNDASDATTSASAQTVEEDRADKNPAGEGITYARGGIDPNNPFFQAIGENGRSCGTCHMSADGWTISARTTQRLFDETDGTHPLFRTVDGSNRPDADVSTLEARRAAYSMLRTKANIRMHFAIPDGAEFKLESVDNPYGYTDTKELSLFRRPLPIANVAFISAGAWDGRGSVSQMGLPAVLGGITQAAAVGHQQAAIPQGQSGPLTDAQLQSVLKFITNLYFAQNKDAVAGALSSDEHGAARRLSSQEFFLGINDPLTFNPRHTPFDPNAITLFSAPASVPPNDAAAAARASIARGQALFNTKPIKITGVAGLNDLPNLATVDGHCTTCHDAPNVGDHSWPMALNIGQSDAARRTPDLPLYTLRRLDSSGKPTDEVVQTTDPGRALATGKWADIGKFKGPILRGLASRAPYFHAGSAATLGDVVDFYDGRFGVHFTPAEKADLVAFLNAL